MFDNSARILQLLSENLSQLDYLDLSGTNLPGVVNDSCEQNALPGWPADRKLSFLGLWRCPENACFREHLPAHRIAGEANEEQLIAALEAYADWLLATQRILYSLCNLVTETNATIHSAEHLFELVLERMQRYPSDTYMHFLASMLISFLIDNHIHIDNISPLRVRTLVQVLVNTLERYPDDNEIVDYCCRTLCEVRTYSYSQLFHLSKRLLKVLIKYAKDASDTTADESSGKVMALTVLRKIVSSENPELCSLFRDLGGLQMAISTLEHHLQDNELNDEVVTISWSLLCYEADYSNQISCMLLIDLHGLELYLHYMDKWPVNGFLYLILLPMSRLAKVKSLRGYLKVDQLIAILLQMIDFFDFNISYRTALLLSFMLADGENLWHHKAGCEDALLPPVALAYSHAAVTERIVAATERWKPWHLNSEICILYGYESFKPILSIITASDSFASQYCAAWTLNNLTLDEPNKYCPMLFRDGALNRLDAAIADARTPDRLRHLLVLTAGRIREHKRRSLLWCSL